MALETLASRMELLLDLHLGVLGATRRVSVNQYQIVEMSGAKFT